MSQYPDRIRFNWGYHNGANPKIQTFAPKPNHFDKVYIAAWYLGKHDFEKDKYTGNSDEAWQLYKASKKQEAAQCKAIRSAVPEREDYRV